MKYSQLFGKTVKSPPAEATTASHKLLYQAGFIRESTAGRYYFLPLGIRVMQKVIAAVKQLMDAAGSQELVTPVLHPLELWQETNRVNAANFELMQITDRRGAQFALGGTAEEMIVDLVRKFQISYRDLPFSVYQFSTKFRDEMRARGGLLRVREFIMKDAYSFHTTDEQFKTEYQNMHDTYSKIFSTLGLTTVPVPADNGYFGGDYCHEFIVESPIGESPYFVSEDGQYVAHEDIAQFDRGQINSSEEIKTMETINQPSWVKTMDDNIKHYNLPANRFLKNIVYKNRVTGEIFIAVIRGDLEVNKNKLEALTQSIGQLDDATSEDLTKLGTQPGYVHSWGHDATYVGDLSLKSVTNFIGGQKTDETDTTNVNYGRDFECKLFGDIALAQDGFIAPDGKSKLIAKKGIEVGNIFSLGTHYSTKMTNATFTDQDGQTKPYHMGCYGIGIGRTLASVVEIHHDDRGIIWPDNIAPFQVHLIGLDLQEDEIKKQADSIYQSLLNQNIEVLFDDREERAGTKFADADLIGCPWRVVVSRKSAGQIEVKRRNQESSSLMTLEQFTSALNA